MGSSPDRRSRIRVLVADDDAAVRSALGDLFESDDEIEVVGLVCDGHQAVQAAADSSPDVVLIDLHMAFGGPDLVRALHGENASCAVICFSADDFGRDAMIKAGVQAFALKGDPSLDLLTLIHEARH